MKPLVPWARDAESSSAVFPFRAGDNGRGSITMALGRGKLHFYPILLGSWIYFSDSEPGIQIVNPAEANVLKKHPPVSHSHQREHG